MRYKRINTLALDLSVLQKFPGVLWIQTILKQIVPPEHLKCVQLHSSKKILYVGLQDTVSAADVLKNNVKKKITMSDGTKIPLPLVLVEEDVVDVRVRDVPPEIPNDIIKQTLREHGEVLAVSNETWKNFFVGLPTGGRIVRMKIEKDIPSHIKIGNSLARINYPGMTETCRCGLPSHRGHPCKEARARQHIEPTQPEAIGKSGNGNTQQKGSTNSASPGSSSALAAAGETKAADMDADDDATSTPFTIVTRKRSMMAKKTDPGDNSDSSSAELENSVLFEMNEKEAHKLGPANFEKWLALKSGSKIKIITNIQ